MSGEMCQSTERDDDVNTKARRTTKLKSEERKTTTDKEATKDTKDTKEE
jgi:hypothetical protein